MAFAPPDAAAVRGEFPGFDWETAGYPPDADPDRLDGRIVAAVAWVERMTGRTLDSSLPANLETLAVDAVMLRTVQTVVARSDVEAAAGGDDLKSMRAGDYQETRRDLGELRDAQMLSPWRELSDLLWLLCTPEKAAEHRAELSGIPAPAAVVVETDWGAGWPSW